MSAVIKRKKYSEWVFQLSTEIPHNLIIDSWSFRLNGSALIKQIENFSTTFIIKFKDKRGVSSVVAEDAAKCHIENYLKFIKCPESSSVTSVIPYLVFKEQQLDCDNMKKKKLKIIYKIFIKPNMIIWKHRQQKISCMFYVKIKASNLH